MTIQQEIRRILEKETAAMIKEVEKVLFNQKKKVRFSKVKHV